MKKVVSLIIVFVLLMGLTIPALAASDTEIQPRYAYIESLGTDISINQSAGTASCSGYITAQDYSSVKVHVQLQVKKNGSWQALYSKTATGAGYASTSFQYGVTKGYAYRVVTNVYVYNAQGVLQESNVLYDFESYPSS